MGMQGQSKCPIWQRGYNTIYILIFIFGIMFNHHNFGHLQDIMQPLELSIFQYLNSIFLTFYFPFLIFF